MLDYMLPRKVMSWKEAFELYFEEQMMKGLFEDLAFYGITPPKHVEDAIAEKEILSHQVYWVLYQFSFAAGFTTSVPDDEHLKWLSQDLPRHLREVLPAVVGQGEEEHRGRRPALRARLAAAVPGLPDPDGVHRAR